MKPDWNEAPFLATHWDTVDECFCDAEGWWAGHYGEYYRVIPCIGRYIQRPVGSKDKTEELTR